MFQGFSSGAWPLLKLTNLAKSLCCQLPKIILELAHPSTVIRNIKFVARADRAKSVTIFVTILQGNIFCTNLVTISVETSPGMERAVAKFFFNDEISAKTRVLILKCREISLILYTDTLLANQRVLVFVLHVMWKNESSGEGCVVLIQIECVPVHQLTQYTPL